MRVQLINKPASGWSGTARYATTLRQGLQEVGIDACASEPEPPILPARLAALVRGRGWDLGAFFGSYPLSVPQAHARGYHLTSQTLATLLLRSFPAPTIVTVLDLIPLQAQQDGHPRPFRHPVDALFYRLGLLALRRANAIIAISHHTRQQLVERLRLPPEQIEVVHLPVDGDRFRPRSALPAAFRHRYGLDPDHRYLLYVGSEDPRKNLEGLLHAFAAARQAEPRLRLCKVGTPHFPGERARLEALAERLGVRDATIWIDSLPDAELPFFYNMADLFVMPSLYEGFGLPLLEAMASGTPVLSSNRGALPEVAGEGALLVDPSDPWELAHGITALLADKAGAATLAQRGLERARRFTTGAMVAKTVDLYERTFDTRAPRHARATPHH